MLWLNGFPLPPSVNSSLIPVIGKTALNNKGKRYWKGRMMKTKVAHDFTWEVLAWKQKNLSAVNAIRKEIFELKKATESAGRVFALRVDCYFVFHVERILTVNNLPEGIDADNRLKPCWDAIKMILSIDDRHFFAGQCEKLTTLTKESECSIIKISQMTPRTHQEIRAQMLQDSKQGS